MVKPKNPKWTKSIGKVEKDKLDIGKPSPTSKKVLTKVHLSDKIFDDAAAVPTPDMNKAADFSNFLTKFKKRGF